MEQFASIPYSVYQAQSTLPRKQKLEQKQEKDKIVPQHFDSVYSAVNARLETSNNKHIIDIILNYPRNNLSQSDIIILVIQDKKSIVEDFVCALKRKKHQFFGYLLYKFGSNSTST